MPFTPFPLMILEKSGVNLFYPSGSRPPALLSGPMGVSSCDGKTHMVVSGSMTGTNTHITPPRPASTVIIIRKTGRVPQVCLLKRSKRSPFMAGYHVFPGGTVDEGDKDALWEKHCDIEGPPWIQKPGRDMPEEDLLPYGIAAVRETFEEAGILLAHGDGHREKEIASLSDKRCKGALHSGWLKAWVVSRGWRPSLSNLYPWAHWVTPEVRSKRFDTRFFITFVAREVTCIPDGRETVEGVWVEPGEALSNNLNGRLPLSPPTLITLHELLAYRDAGSLHGALETRTWGTPRCPRLVPASDGALLVLPWDPGFHDEEISWKVGPGDLLPVGKAFSRLWLQAGIWRPVAP